MRFTFQNGDTPLPGYTIKRGVGHGGFGEVYYAVSDSGKEAALKLIQQHHEVELRGVRQCMNLRHAHLVAVHDVRENEQGQSFVIMEYMSGPNLRRLIDEADGALGEAKAVFFLRELAKPVDYLHDRGIVHRDLKPSNVFIDEGCVKVGDYGLSKFITASKHSGLTMAVGTVHYMAPEVGSGRYTKAIDVYALGVILYEMLAGEPPFDGESVGEILMKHLTAEPDLGDIQDPFRGVIAKALAKNPDDRPESAADMVSALLADSRVTELLEGEGLSDGRTIDIPVTISEADTADAEEIPSRSDIGETAQEVADLARKTARQAGKLIREGAAKARHAAAERRRRKHERLRRAADWRDRREWPLHVVQALVLCIALGTAGGILFGGPHSYAEWSGYLSLSVLACVLGILMARRIAATAQITQPWAIRLLTVGLCAPLLLCIGPVCGRLLARTGMVVLPTATFLFEHYIPFLLLLVLLLNWHARFRADRRWAISLIRTATAAFVGMILASIFLHGSLLWGACVGGAVSLIVQAVSPRYRDADVHEPEPHRPEQGGRGSSHLLAGLGLFMILIIAGFAAITLPRSSPVVLFVAAALLMFLLPHGVHGEQRRLLRSWLKAFAIGAFILCMLASAAFILVTALRAGGMGLALTSIPARVPALTSLFAVGSGRLAITGKGAILVGLAVLVFLLWPRKERRTGEAADASQDESAET